MYPNYYVAINVPKLVWSHFSTQISMSRMTDFCFLLIYQYCTLNSMEQLICRTFSILFSTLLSFTFTLLFSFHLKCLIIYLDGAAIDFLLSRTLSILSFLLCYLIHWLFFFLSISNVGVATYFLISGTLSILSLLNCCLSQITLILFFPSGIHYLYYPDCAATDFLISNTILSFPLMSFTLRLK